MINGKVKNISIPYKDWFSKTSEAIRCSIYQKYSLSPNDYEFISNRLISKLCCEIYDKDEKDNRENIDELICAIKYIFNNGQGEIGYNYKKLRQQVADLLNEYFKFRVSYSCFVDDNGYELERRLANFDKYLIGYGFVCKNKSARDFIVAEAEKLKAKDYEYNKSEAKFNNKSFFERVVSRFRRKQRNNEKLEDIELKEIVYWEKL